jgi:small subunit ribosomal protein S17
MESNVTSAPTNLRAARKTREGVVVSDKMDKTRVVLVSWESTHRKYRKVIRLSTRYYAHDEKNDAKTGDRVEITETRPMSKLKRWRIVRVVQRGA